MFRARLTALAPDAGVHSRDDIYTLLVTARMINFFKGLRWEGPKITLPEALEMAGRNGKRAELGVELFRRLMRENRLYAATREGWRPLTRFRVPLFLELWHSLGDLSTQEGQTIIVNPPPSS
jgi:hypothetical protein